MAEGPRVIARLLVELEVHQETEPTISTPDAHEPGYDYAVVRGARLVGAYDLDRARLPMLEHQVAERTGDLDPDDLVTQTIYSLVAPTVEDPAEPTEE